MVTVEPPLGFGRTGDWQHECEAEICRNDVKHHVDMDQNHWRKVTNTWWNQGHKELRLIREQREELPSISRVFLIKCSVSV